MPTQPTEYKPLPLGIIADCDQCHERDAKWIYLEYNWLCDECKRENLKERIQKTILEVKEQKQCQPK